MKTQDYIIKPCGDNALSLYFSNYTDNDILEKILSLKVTVESKNYNFIIDMIPCLTSLFIEYNPFMIDFTKIAHILQNIEISESQKLKERYIEIPICYEFGLDFERIGKKHKLSKEEIITIHSNTLYRVYMLGFVAGFPYIIPIRDIQSNFYKLHTKRLDTPRIHVESGSIGIADDMVGIYPLSLPGGWNIIGRTPYNIFDKHDGALFQVGDYISFKPISSEIFKDSESTLKDSLCL